MVLPNHRGFLCDVQILRVINHSRQSIFKLFFISDSSKTSTHLEEMLSTPQILTKHDTDMQTINRLLLRSRQKIVQAQFRSRQGLEIEINCFESNLLPSS